MAEEQQTNSDAEDVNIYTMYDGKHVIYYVNGEEVERFEIED